MQKFGENRIGVFDESLIKSALARPQFVALYELADLIKQASNLWFGLIKNHPWKGGNRRTATFLTKHFLQKNGFDFTAETQQLVEVCAFIQNDIWKVDEIENWLRERVERTE